MAMLILLVLLIFFAALGVPADAAIGATVSLASSPNFITMLPQRVSERRLQRADDRHAAVYAGR